MEEARKRASAQPSENLSAPSCLQAFLRFELYNRGYNFPTVSNGGLAPIRTVIRHQTDPTERLDFALKRCRRV